MDAHCPRSCLLEIHLDAVVAELNEEAEEREKYVKRQEEEKKGEKASITSDRPTV